MADTNTIREQARERSRQMGLPYAGALLPSEAFELMQTESNAKLIDVRTRAELDFVGRVPDSIDIEWKSYPSMQLNHRFAQQLAQKVPQDAVVMFICRSGGRSHEAALAALQAGYKNAYNVLEGFEGDRDQEGHRSTVGGWRAAGLPWVQS